MKSIGFIDHYIDEGHANNFPRFIRNSSLGSEFAVTMAWDEIRPAGKKSLDEWCSEHQVKRACTLKEVVESCDCLVVLSPDNPECQQRLAELPLQSGKPVYFDKPFTASRAAAAAAFVTARKHRTPLMSCSALRFAPGMLEARKKLGVTPTFAATRGPGRFLNYSVHQAEMIVCLLGTGARRVMQCGNEEGAVMLIDYGDQRRGTINLVPGVPFGVSLRAPDRDAVVVDGISGFMEPFIEEMLQFFKSGVSPIAEAETIEVIALVDSGLRAQETPDTWIDVIK